MCTFECTFLLALHSLLKGRSIYGQADEHKAESEWDREGRREILMERNSNREGLGARNFKQRGRIDRKKAEIRIEIRIEDLVTLE